MVQGKNNKPILRRMGLWSFGKCANNISIVGDNDNDDREIDDNSSNNNHDKTSHTSSNLFATTSAPSQLSPFLKISTRRFGFSNNDFIRFESVLFFELDLSSGSTIPVIVQDDAKRVRSFSAKRENQNL